MSAAPHPLNFNDTIMIHSTPIIYANNVNAIDNGEGIILEFRGVVPSIFNQSPVTIDSETPPERKEISTNVNLSGMPPVARIFLSRDILNSFIEVIRDTPTTRIIHNEPTNQ